MLSSSRANAFVPFIWVILLCVPADSVASYAQYKNITVEAGNRRVLLSDGWRQAGAYGYGTCSLWETVSFRFQGIAFCYLGGPQVPGPFEIGGVIAEVKLRDDLIRVVDLSSGYSDDRWWWEVTSFCWNGLQNDQYDLQITFIRESSETAVKSCGSLAGFIYTTVDGEPQPPPPGKDRTTTAPPMTSSMRTSSVATSTTESSNSPTPTFTLPPVSPESDNLKRLIIDSGIIMGTALVTWAMVYLFRKFDRPAIHRHFSIYGSTLNWVGRDQINTFDNSSSTNVNSHNVENSVHQNSHNTIIS